MYNHLDIEGLDEIQGNFCWGTDDDFIHVPAGVSTVGHEAWIVAVDYEVDSMFHEEFFEEIFADVVGHAWDHLVDPLDAANHGQAFFFAH
eukprot:jgi/Pico_ML_1/53546/g4077.t1